MSRSPIRARLARIWAQLKLRLANEAPDPPAPPQAASRWDQPLTGDNWIGVFLIGLSVLTYIVALQHY